MAISDAQYNDALKEYARQYIIKIEVLDWSENVIHQIEDGFINGNIQSNLQNGCRTTATITLKNENGQFTPQVGGLVWFNRKYRIYTGLRVNGEDRFNSQGIFVLYKPSLVSDFGTKTITLNLYDKGALLTGELAGKLLSDYVITQGTNMVDAIRAVLRDGSEVKSLLSTPTTSTLPYSLIGKTGGTRFADLINKLAEANTYYFYFDKNGYPVFKPVTDALSLPTKFEFNNVTPLYRGGNKDLNRPEIYSKIKVIGCTVDGQTFSAIAEDTTTDSPTNSTNLGMEVGNPIIDDVIYNVDLCQQRANYELLKAISYYESISIKCIAVDTLSVGDVISISDTALGLSNPTRYQIQNINLPIRMNEEMTLGLWQIRPLNLL